MAYHCPMDVMLDIFSHVADIGFQAVIAAGCVYGLNEVAKLASALRSLKNAPVIKLDQDGDVVETILGNEGTIIDPFQEAYIPYAVIVGYRHRPVGSLNIGQGNNSSVSVVTPITAVGQLVVSSDGRQVKVQPPPSGLKFHLVPESLDALISQQECEIRMQYLFLILSGSLAIGLMLRSGYRIYQIYRSTSPKYIKNEKKDAPWEGTGSSLTDSSKTDNSKTTNVKTEGS